MRKTLVTGALGQIGSELVPALRRRYGTEHVVATDIRMPTAPQDGPSTPKDKTPQDTIQHPTTMYSVTKVAGELLATGLNYPVVPKGDEEIRFQISADHTPADIDEALDVLASFEGSMSKT